MSIIYEALKKVDKQKQKSAVSFEQEVSDNSKVQFLAETAHDKIIKKEAQNQLGLDSEIKHFFGRRKIVLTSILLILIVAFLAAKIVDSGSRPVKTAAKSRGINQGPVASTLQKKIYTNTTAYDTVINFALEGIMYDDKGSSAIINGQVVKESARIGNFIVGQIKEDEVVLINPQDETKLILTLTY